MFIFYVTYIVSLLYLSLDRLVVCFLFLFFFKQKTAYEMRISDWSSDVCSSDLVYMVTGSPGGSTIISTVMQSIVNVVAFGMNMQQAVDAPRMHMRSEEHTSELQSLMRISYAVFCLKKKK